MGEGSVTDMLMLLLSSRGARIVDIPEPQPAVIYVPTERRLKIRFEHMPAVPVAYREFVRTGDHSYIEREAVRT
jgi:hypothetical protein